MVFTSASFAGGAITHSPSCPSSKVQPPVFVQGSGSFGGFPVGFSAVSAETVTVICGSVAPLDRG